VPLRGASIAQSYADWTGPRQPEEDIFGTGDSERIAALVDRFGSEPALIGQIGYGFTTDWSIHQEHRVPTLEEVRAFVSDWGSEADEDSYRGRLARHGCALLE
jgi:hypothetical protein